MSEDEAVMLNGYNANGLLEEVRTAYEVQHRDTKESPRHDNTQERQRRINTNVKGLEETVKKILGESLHASKEQAEAIVGQLAYATAQADGFAGKPEEFDDEKIRKYLSDASSALGDPTIGNKTDFIESIMNMISAKPGDVRYDPNSSLANLINYVAAQNDTESRRMNYVQRVINEYWTKPGIGVKLQGLFNKIFGIPLGPTATAGNAFSELNQRAGAESQKYDAERTKTYQTGAADNVVPLPTTQHKMTGTDG